MRKFLFSSHFLQLHSLLAPAPYSPKRTTDFEFFHMLSLHLFGCFIYSTQSQAPKGGSAMLEPSEGLCPVCRLWWWWMTLSWGQVLGVEQERWKREGPAWILGFLSPHWPLSLNLFVSQDSSFLLLGIPVALASPWWCLHWQGFVREPVSIV